MTVENTNIAKSNKPWKVLVLVLAVYLDSSTGIGIGNNFCQSTVIGIGNSFHEYC